MFNVFSLAVKSCSMSQISFSVSRAVLISQIVSAHTIKVTKHRHCNEFVALVVGICEAGYNVCLH